MRSLEPQNSFVQRPHGLFWCDDDTLRDLKEASCVASRATKRRRDAGLVRQNPAGSPWASPVGPATLAMHGPSPSSGAHPHYYLNMRCAGAGTDDVYPFYPIGWWETIRPCVILRPGRQLELAAAAPPELPALLASPIVQDLITGNLENGEPHIVYNNGVGSVILQVVCDEVMSRFGGSVDAALRFGVCLPEGCEEALRLLCVAAPGHATTLFQLPPKRASDDEATAPFRITKVISDVVAAVCHNFGREQLDEFLSNDLKGLLRPEPLWQFYSHGRHSICSPSQRKAVWTLLLVGRRLNREAGPAARLPALPNEVLVYHILRFMQFQDLGPFSEM